MSISFDYPYTGSATSSITLRNPDYGDSELYDVNTMFHISMDGTVYSYRKANRQTILLNFSALSKAKIDELITFYLDTAGYEIKYTDTLGNEWRTRIINNPLEAITTVGRGNCELNTMTLQLRVCSATVGTNVLIDNTSNTLVDDVGNVLSYT